MNDDSNVVTGDKLEKMKAVLSDALDEVMRV